MDVINQNQKKVLAFIAIFTGPFGFILSMVNELRNNWESVVEIFKTDGIIAGLKRLAGVLLSGLLAPIQGLLELLAKIPGVGEKLGPAMEKIEEFRNTLKGTEEMIEKPLLARPGSVGKETAAAVEAAPPPAALTNPAPVAPAVPPAITTAGSPISDVQAPAMRQPALLNLWEGRLFSAGPVRQSPATAFVTQSPTAISPVPAPIAQAALPAAATVSVPVKYNFPELIVPPELIRPVSMPVSWVYPQIAKAPFRSTAFTSPARNITRTTSSVSGGGRGRYAPAVSLVPPILDRAIPPAAESPIAPSVGTALVPPAPPMTRAEQMAAEQVLYSKTENHETVDLKISLDKGLEARVVNPPKSPNVKLEVSGTV
jgi:hypothetical protein